MKLRRGGGDTAARARLLQAFAWALFPGLLIGLASAGEIVELLERRGDVGSALTELARINDVYGDTPQASWAESHRRHLKRLHTSSDDGTPSSRLLR